jgi:hypothetical protein
VLRECRTIHPMSHKTIGSGNAADDQGDIAFGTEFLIECKFHKKLTRKQVQTFFMKIEDEAERRSRIPLLVFKENNRDAMVMFRTNLLGHVDDRLALMYWDDFLDAEREAKTIKSGVVE